MVEIILNRILVVMEEIKKEHEVTMPDGTVLKLQVAYGELEGRIQASVTEGVVVQIGPDAYTDYGYKENKPFKVGDKVQFAKYAGRGVFDPDEPTKRLVVINDEDVLAIIKSKEKTNEC
jgi:co-chaperonin GroES (HSP10)